VAANNYGDGIKLWAGGSLVENALVVGTGGGDAGSPWSGIVIGDENTAGAAFTLVNCTVHDNPDRQAYPLYAQYPPASNPIRVTLRNCVFSGGHGPLYFGESVHLACEYNLFHRPGQDVQVEAFGRGYSAADIEAGLLGPGNRVGDPLFERPAWGAEGDYRLSSGSPARDAGSPDAPAVDLDGNSRPSGPAVDMGCHEAAASGLPGRPALPEAGFRLFQNRPNPFNPATRIAFALAEPGFVRLAVLDLRGRFVCVVAEGRFAAGRHEAELDAGRLAAGTYVCRLEAGDLFRTIKLTVLR
jgi:hypothetical protein